MSKKEVKSAAHNPKRLDHPKSSDDHRATAARGSAGRPSTMTGGKRVNVYLDDASLARATVLGDGNVSEGIRLALAKSAQ
ncbi:MAG: hypothetical protein ACRYG5_06695 [Janthinobacterium lividum]